MLRRGIPGRENSRAKALWQEQAYKSLRSSGSMALWVWWVLGPQLSWVPPDPENCPQTLLEEGRGRRGGGKCRNPWCTQVSASRAAVWGQGGVSYELEPLRLPHQKGKWDGRVGEWGDVPERSPGEQGQDPLPEGAGRAWEGSRP